MKRLLVSVFFASVTAACGDGAASLISPTPASVADAPVESTDLMKRYVISGNVTSMVKPVVAVSNARVRLVGGPSAGMTTVSDADGTFMMIANAGTVVLEVSHPEFQTWTKDIFLSANTKVRVELSK